MEIRVSKGVPAVAPPSSIIPWAKKPPRVFAPKPPMAMAPTPPTPPTVSLGMSKKGSVALWLLTKEAAQYRIQNTPDALRWPHNYLSTLKKLAIRIGTDIKDRGIQNF